MNPASILSQQANKAMSQLDQEWSDKYQQLNKLYDWGRHEKDPDEINRLRDRLEQDINSRRGQIKTSYGNQMSKFKMLDQLFEHDPEQANRLKWEATVGKDVAKQMFPQKRDPRLEHRDVLAEERRMLDNVGSYAMGRDGRLYHAATDKKGYFTDQPDKSAPATQQEMELWVASAQALDVLGQQKLGLVQGMAEAGVPNPNRLQDLMISQEKESLFNRLAKGWFKYSTPGLTYRGAKAIVGTPEPKGTFADKVRESVVEPQRQQPRVRQQKRSRKELLDEYSRLGGSRTPEGRAFADKNLG